MKKIILAAVMLAASAASSFATVDTNRTIYLPVQGMETEYDVVPFPVIEVVGIPHLAIAPLMGREFLVPMVGGGQNTLVNLNAMAGAVVTLDNEQALIDGEDYKVSGVTVDLSRVAAKNDSGFAAAVRKAVAKTFDLKEGQVKVLTSK